MEHIKKKKTGSFQLETTPVFAVKMNKRLRVQRLEKVCITLTFIADYDKICNISVSMPKREQTCEYRTTDLLFTFGTIY